MTSNHTIKASSETESDAGTFVCRLCDGKSFRQKSQLTAHLLTHGEKKEDATKEDQSDEQKPFVCEICSKAFNWLSYLEQHLLYRHAKCTASKPLGRVRRQASQEVCQSEERKRWGPVPCEFCGKTFSRRDDLLPHHRRAHPEELTACDECGKKFAPDWLKGHIRRIHQTDAGQLYVCVTCDKEFALENSLKTHRLIHAEEKVKENLVCKLCDMEFSSEQAFDNHNWCHTVDRPFTCDYCGKGFVSEGRLKRHAKTHDAREGQATDPVAKKPFTCEKCDRNFVQKGHLVMHTRFAHN